MTLLTLLENSKENVTGGGGICAERGVGELLGSVTASRLSPLAYSDFTPLMKSLFVWADKNHPEAAQAIADHLESKDYCMRCFGSIFRRCCYADPSWLWRVIEWSPDEVIRLSPCIGELDPARMGGLQIPGRMGWRQWIAAADAANVINWQLGSKRT